MLYAHILELDDHLNELSIREIDIADHLGALSELNGTNAMSNWGKSTLDVLLNSVKLRSRTVYDKI